jgi:hypothetical protein
MVPVAGAAMTGRATSPVTTRAVAMRIAIIFFFTTIPPKFLNIQVLYKLNGCGTSFVTTIFKRPIAGTGQLIDTSVHTPF